MTKRAIKKLVPDLNNLEKRLQFVRQELERRTLDAFLVSKTENRFYLSGWPGDSESGFLLFTADKNYLFTDSRYSEQAFSLTHNYKIVDFKTNFPTAFAELVASLGLNRVGYESHDLSVFNFTRIRKIAKIRLVPLAHLLEERRAFKDELEISKIKKAVHNDTLAFKYILNFLKPGMTEAEVAWELEKKLKELGAERMGWQPFIVAAGVNSSMPHYGNSRKVKIKRGDTLQLDFAGVYEGYHSDTSRVIFVGKPTQEQIEVYTLVLDAQRLGESLVKPGKSGAAIDRQVREFLKGKTKFYFKHGLGHGVGLEIHELPHVSPTGAQKLESGNCLTVEPGIYRPGWGGMRVEDVVVVTESGCDVLTKAPKDLKDVTL